jgi:hypothetical protein
MLKLNEGKTFFKELRYKKAREFFALLITI